MVQLFNIIMMKFGMFLPIKVYGFQLPFLKEGDWLVVDYKGQCCICACSAQQRLTNQWLSTQTLKICNNIVKTPHSLI